MRQLWAPNLSKLKQNQLISNRNADKDGLHGVEIQIKAAWMGSNLKKRRLVLNRNSNKKKRHRINSRTEALGIESKLKDKAKQGSSRGPILDFRSLILSDTGLYRNFCTPGKGGAGFENR